MKKNILRALVAVGIIVAISQSMVSALPPVGDDGRQPYSVTYNKCYNDLTKGCKVTKLGN